jgi:hypothetical protein
MMQFLGHLPLLEVEGVGLPQLRTGWLVDRAAAHRQLAAGAQETLVVTAPLKVMLAKTVAQIAEVITGAAVGAQGALVRLHRVALAHQTPLADRASLMPPVEMVELPAVLDQRRVEREAGAAAVDITQGLALELQVALASLLLSIPIHSPSQTLVVGLLFQLPDRLEGLRLRLLPPVQAMFLGVNNGTLRIFRSEQHRD